MDVPLSKSSISLFEQCTKKFKLRYIDKDYGIAKQESIAPSIFGNVIHESMEEYFQKDNKRPILDIYKQKFAESDLRDKEKFDLGRFKICDYASGDSSRVVALEKDFDLYLDNGVHIRGFIDRINHISEDECEVEDYKTGFSLPLSKKELEEDLQLGMYALAVQILYPQYKTIRLTLNYLHHGKLSCYRTQESLDALKDYLAVMYDKICRFYDEGGKTEKPILNNYCSYCEYRHKCSVFKSVLDSNELDKSIATINGLMSVQNGVVIEHDKIGNFLFEIKKKMSILKKVEVDIKDYIKTKMSEKDAQEISIGNSRFYMTQKKNVIYDVNTVLELARDNSINPVLLLDTRKMAIDSAFKGNKVAMDKLNSTSKVEYGSSYVK